MNLRLVNVTTQNAVAEAEQHENVAHSMTEIANVTEKLAQGSQEIKEGLSNIIYNA